jgi:hypothetical protein
LALFIAACSAEPGIRGTVTDADGKPVPGAQAKLTKAGDPARAIVTVNTGADGKYTLSNPEPGQYLLTLSWLNPGQCTNSGGPLSRKGNFLVALAQRNGRNAVIAVSDEIKVSANSGQVFDLKVEQCHVRSG